MKQAGPKDPLSKGPSRLRCRLEPIRESRPHPPLDSHISLRAARFIYYVQPLTPLPSWRRVFQFLISLLRRGDTQTLPELTLKFVTHLGGPLPTYLP